MPVLRTPRGLISKTPSGSRAPNFVYIWGPSGSEKSFLAEQIVTTRLAHDPRAKVRNARTHEILNEVVDAIRGERLLLLRLALQEFDAIVVDDIDQMRGKEGLQEELYHLLIAPAENSCRQVIMTSSVPLWQLRGLERRLRGLAGMRAVTLRRPSFPVRLSWAVALAGDNVPQFDLVEIARVEDSFHSIRGAVVTHMAHTTVNVVREA